MFLIFPFFNSINIIMFIDDLLHNQIEQKELLRLKALCSQFIETSNGIPLLKNLPHNYNDLQRVKVRKRKHEADIDEMFNEVFENEHHALRQRAIFANGPRSFEPQCGKTEPFYIFPIDDFKFLYSPEVENSNKRYKHVFNTIFEQFGNKTGKEIVTDLLRFTYKSENINNGIKSGSEIIIFGIPFYYAIRCSSDHNYETLLTIIQEIE